MELLESAMAFAVAMIIFSTIVTGIVELLVRVAGMREKNLKNMVESLFEKVIWPRMKGHLERLGDEDEDKAKERLTTQFIEDMTGNPASLAKETSITAHRGTVDVLTPLAFAERLGRTDVGKAILAEGEAQLDLLVQDFVRSFDRFGRAASEVFRKKAKQTAIVVGIVFALAANIEAGRLFTTLMNNPDLRSGLIAEAETAAQANKEAMESLAELVERIEKDKLEDDQTEAIKAQADKIEASIKAIDGKGLPIGHIYYPYCSEGVAGDLACADSSDPLAALGKALRWLLLSITAGILIGLGGPFWFRVFSSLSQVFQVMRALGVGSKPQQAKPEELAATSDAEDSAKPKDVADAFRVAALVHAHAAVSSERALLGPDGQEL